VIGAPHKDIPGVAEMFAPGMRKRSHIHRPGLTAIAAVLAIPVTQASAQGAAPDVSMQDPAPAVAPAAPQDSGPAATAPAQAVQSQIIQPLPSSSPKLPELPVPAQADEALSQAATPAPKKAEATPKVAQAKPVKAEPETMVKTSVVPAFPPATPAKPTIPSPSLVPPIVDARPATPPPVETAPAATLSQGVSMETMLLLGSGLMLVIGGGGLVAYASSRRRKNGPRKATPEAPKAAPRLVAKPVAEAPQPKIARPEPVKTVPATARANLGKRDAALETMIAAQPSSVNPFTTRKNRLRRAHYLLRTGQAAPERAEGEAVALAPADRWSVMRFGAYPTVRTNLKSVKG
jgi:hypothetical protein